MARVLLVCSLIMSIPIALAVATATHSQARLEAAAQYAERHRASARLLEDVPLTSRGSDNIQTTARAEAVWTGPTGMEQKGLVTVPAGTRAGSTVPIWLDRDGRRTERPLSKGDIVGRTVGHVVVTLLVLSMLEFAAYASLRTALDR